MPYCIWRVLPTVFADKLPSRPGGGYERLGFLDENAAGARPIGTTHVEDRWRWWASIAPRATSGAYREAPGAPRRIVLGMPAHQMDLQGYARFLAACAEDPRFDGGTLLDAISQEDPEFSWLDRLLYHFVVVSRTKQGILDRARENAWFDRRPPQGPGRVDTFNPYKVLLRLDC